MNLLFQMKIMIIKKNLKKLGLQPLRSVYPCFKQVQILRFHRAIILWYNNDPLAKAAMSAKWSLRKIDLNLNYHNFWVQSVLMKL